MARGREVEEVVVVQVAGGGCEVETEWEWEERGVCYSQE